jgi:hypothetical protein
MNCGDPLIPHGHVASESAGPNFLEPRLLKTKDLDPASSSGSNGLAQARANKYFDAKKPNEKYQFLTTLPNPIAIGASIETVRKLEQFVQFYVLPKTYFRGVTKAVMKEYVDIFISIDVDVLLTSI